jgi:hypothetical protein
VLLLHCNDTKQASTKEVDNNWKKKLKLPKNDNNSNNNGVAEVISMTKVACGSAQFLQKSHQTTL